MRSVRSVIIAGLACAFTFIGVMMIWQAIIGQPVGELFTSITHMWRKEVAVDGEASVSTVLIGLLAIVVVSMVFATALEVFASNRTPGSGLWLILSGAIFGGVFWMFTHMFFWNAADAVGADNFSKAGAWFAATIAGAVTAVCLLPARLPEERFVTIDPEVQEGPRDTPLPH